MREGVNILEMLVRFEESIVRLTSTRWTHHECTKFAHGERVWCLLDSRIVVAS